MDSCEAAFESLVFITGRVIMLFKHYGRGGFSCKEKKSNMYFVSLTDLLQATSWIIK